MISSIKDIRGNIVRGADGDIGKIIDVFFDDDRWTIRYLVVETDQWLKGRRVLISPGSLNKVEWKQKVIESPLSYDQVRNAPDINTAQPISRQLETEFNRYYRLPFYWGGDAIYGMGMTPGSEAAATIAGDQMEERQREIETGQGAKQSHLRSANDVIDDGIRARDGDIGKLSDFLFDTDTLRINYMVIDTSNWFGGKRVTLPPSWVTKVDWTEKRIYVDLNRDTIKNSPDYDLATLNRDQRETAEAKR